MLRRLACLLAFAALALTAAAEPRYALLIGNEDYPATVGPLRLPHQDVENMRNGLLQAGFPAEHIRVLSDAGQVEINLAVAELASDLRAAGDEAIGFFYYSGHGGSAESAGRRANYLIPAKSPITGAEQLPILGVPVNNIVDALAASNAKAVFIVSDACRNTLPFTSSKGGSADKGMVRVLRKPGLYIAFATADGETTPDDGLFAAALSKRLPQPGLSADRVFTLALREVVAARKGGAMPFTADGLTEDICFTGCDAVPAANDPEGAAYLTAGRRDTVDGYLDFMEAYPESHFFPSAQEAAARLFYEMDPSAEKYMSHDLVSGPPALLEALLHAGTLADFRGEEASAYQLYHLACYSGLGKSCVALGQAIESGYADADIGSAFGKTVDDARRGLMVMAYQAGCVFEDAGSCAWLQSAGYTAWQSCTGTVPSDGDHREFCAWMAEAGILPADM